jgi:hypothetical protein
MGTRGNEDLKLTKEEWEWLYEIAKKEEKDHFIYENNIDDVIQKLLKKEKEGFNFRELNLVMGRRSGKCRYEKDRISTTEGSLTFRELCDRINKKEKIGICTYDPTTLKRSVTYDIKAKDNGFVDCYEIETGRGLIEKSSHNHPYLIWRENNSRPSFVAMSELLVGDRIATANSTELFGKGGIGVKKAALLGHLQGDGGTCHQVIYTTASQEMLDDFKSLIGSEFKQYCVKKIAQQPYDYRVIKNSGKNNQNGSQKNDVKEWLKEMGCFGKKSIDKEIPDCIYKGSKEEVASFLSRLYGCDGWVSINKCPAKNRKKTCVHIGYGSSSKKLIDGVKHLLLKFGIHSYVRSKKTSCNGKKFLSWELVIARKDCMTKFEKEINVFSKENKVKTAVDIASLSGDTNGIFIDMGSSDVKWDIIKSVNFVGKLPTVDLEVNPGHIIGGDIISHNTILASVISAYEAYKLLVINNEDPHAYYGLPTDDEIAIINVALSQDQAGRLFGHIQSRLRNSPFFAGRVAKETTSEIRLYTKEDLKKKAKGAVSGMSTPGSIVIVCGHSNPDTLAGRNAILILFDELAFYDETGKVTGKYFYDRLSPSLSQFFKYGDGRLVEISSPSSMNGIFYEIHDGAKKENGTLSFQLPTWIANPEFSYDHPDLTAIRKRNPDRFAIEYGAQWAKGGTYGNYFEPDLIQRCIRTDLCPHNRPQPGVNYYIHVDPAKSGPRYVAVMVAREKYTNHLGKRRNRIRLANVWIWDPKPGIGLLYNEINNAMVQICATFHPMSVSYDQYNSIQSLELLRSHGIHTVETCFNRGFKNKIYQNLKDLMAYYPQSELWLYDEPRLFMEMRCLKYRPTQRGISLVVDKQGEVQTDDVVDCLAGACAMAGEGLRASLPEPVVVYAGFR